MVKPKSTKKIPEIDTLSDLSLREIVALNTQKSNDIIEKNRKISEYILDSLLEIIEKENKEKFKSFTQRYKETDETVKDEYGQSHKVTVPVIDNKIPLTDAITTKYADGDVMVKSYYLKIDSYNFCVMSKQFYKNTQKPYYSEENKLNFYAYWEKDLTLSDTNDNSNGKYVWYKDLEHGERARKSYIHALEYYIEIGSPVISGLIKAIKNGSIKKMYQELYNQHYQIQLERELTENKKLKQHNSFADQYLELMGDN